MASTVSLFKRRLRNFDFFSLYYRTSIFQVPVRADCVQPFLLFVNNIRFIQTINKQTNKQTSLNIFKLTIRCFRGGGWFSR
jgi:hypothetical protein